ncbi:craniofacial development protein 2 [Trichonephila clavipes]|uniref:Craniofacial development protein 2 n=1 Tax=Trichonephila clavipes TaxID=2585209 RepID=A0A8X6UYL1_TRICX|nr:craniofacial development protein 2 [Trichonephila clavipes]
MLKRSPVGVVWNYSQEIRWLGTGILDKKDCTLYYSCQEKAHHFGVGFIVNKKLRNTVIDFQAISMRLCKIQLRGRHYNTTLICAHAPTDDKDETEKDLFYDLRMKSYNSYPAQDMKLVIGDYNAKIGRELFISSNAGLHSLHKETNENGQRLWDFAVSEKDFGILLYQKTYSSLVQLSNIRKYTNTHGYPLIVKPTTRLTMYF